MAHSNKADVSELVQSGNGFVYDAPVTSNLPLAPLDSINDEKTKKAFGNDSVSSPKTTIEVDVVPSVATAASLKSKLSLPAPKTTVSSYLSSSTSTTRGHLASTTTRKSGYTYQAPIKPFFIA